ncbi:hypothetical protein [Fusibacter sp. 3D3]|uniref:hypothetical protein n=1 Tax=Fusibacter sp. 3D3 TaxID=1048380 RepID=UPI000852D09A|nr:hypothetical protein [Fusibacter sp. 3D3]GAU77060.1 hypothetical protein F3D3_1659 [Fusibacter sp. 3D3]
METIIDQLKQWLILSLSDLLKIKKYIAQKYIKSTQKERAEILSNTVHQVLDKHLSGVDQAHKNALKYSILSSTIGQKKYDISKYDIFKSIFELDLPPSDQITLASDWIDQSTDLNLDASDILEFVIAYSEANDQHYIPERLTDTYRELPSKTALKNLKKHPILDFMQHFFFNPEFVITLFILSIIAITLGSAIVLSEPEPQEINRTLQIVRTLNPRSNSFASQHLFLMKTVSVRHGVDRSDVLIEYEQLKTDKPPYSYEAFNFMTLKSYLLNIRQSYLGESPYLNEVIHISKLNDIDPLLLISIIGQEQNFIPNTHLDKDQIINNPYNVFYSWKVYNTTLSDSTQIAINTIKNSFERKNIKDMDDIEWLNQTYAEDQNWHKGVKEIYTFLNDLCRQ